MLFIMKGGSVTSSTNYTCSLGGSYSSSFLCNAYCYSPYSTGTVSSGTKTTYHCGDGWEALSGNDESLVCYKKASKN